MLLEFVNEKCSTNKPFLLQFRINIAIIAHNLTTVRSNYSAIISIHRVVMK